MERLRTTSAIPSAEVVIVGGGGAGGLEHGGGGGAGGMVVSLQSGIPQLQHHSRYYWSRWTGGEYNTPGNDGNWGIGGNQEVIPCSLPIWTISDTEVAWCLVKQGR